jgi:hypothetical protein
VSLVSGCHSYDFAPTGGHEDDPYFLSLLLNIISCHLFCLCGTLCNVYDRLKTKDIPCCHGPMILGISCSSKGASGEPMAAWEIGRWLIPFFA